MQKFENLNKSINLQIQRAEAAIAAEQAMRKPPPQPTPSEPTPDQPQTADDTSTPKSVAAKLAVPGGVKSGGVPSRPSTPVPGGVPGQSAAIIARPNDEELPRAPKPAPRLTPKQRMLEDHQLVRTVTFFPSPDLMIIWYLVD